MLFRYGFRLGLQLLLRGHTRRGARWVVQPVNYWRIEEYRQVFDAMRFGSADEVLDVGSPKLFSLFLAERCRSRVVATDINDAALEGIRQAQLVRRIPESKLHVQCEDGRSLTFPDGTFDKVYSISVVEHIEGDGDGLCMREIARVLKPGGLACITTAFGRRHRDEYTSKRVPWSAGAGNESSRFYQRRYDIDTLDRRLVKPSGLERVRCVFVGERFLLRSNREVNDFLHPITGWLHPLVSRIAHVDAADRPDQLVKPLCAILVLRKRLPGKGSEVRPPGDGEA